MNDLSLSDLEYEILDTVVDEDETTAIILRDIRDHVNAEAFSEEARALDFAGLDAVFERLRALGLVESLQEATDGFELPRPGVTYSWWHMTTEGRRVWEAWDSAQPGSDGSRGPHIIEVATAETDILLRIVHEHDWTVRSDNIDAETREVLSFLPDLCQAAAALLSEPTEARVDEYGVVQATLALGACELFLQAGDGWERVICTAPRGGPTNGGGTGRARRRSSMRCSRPSVRASRPWRRPVPAGLRTGRAIVIGAGPAYPVLGIARGRVVRLNDDARRGRYRQHKTLWAVRPGVSEELRVRGREQRGPRRLRFLDRDRRVTSSSASIGASVCPRAMNAL